ncbi:SH3 domain-containing protein [Phototrophicus methaneseepsis]|uniref:SH3 domain-containing protein n=1 Tax=Phototrophicus methaneseepsis TaxID=2710758 RepID=A0A7S8IEE6_9CHLR|nr:SH3 domain-containing protein [Phototrophicus methaneseepsis]QPC82364.1 SH3 domain-containing protein [Phototrophicus methaneseepsis]
MTWSDRKAVYGVVGLMLLLSACAPRATGVAPIDSLAQQPTATRNVIYVTPTQQPTSIPTAVPITPSLTPTMTPIPSSTPNVAALSAQCTVTLEQLYTAAGEDCLGQPSGYLCNGGLAPEVEPQQITASIALPGSLVSASDIAWVRGQPLLENGSGGMMWLHLEENIHMNGLILGDVEVRDVTDQNLNLPQWQSFTVKTTQHTASHCSTLPLSSFIVQGEYGVASRLVINGVSTDLNGTLVVQTENDVTHFIMIEGQARFIVFGQAQIAFAGQQLDVRYNDAEFASPAEVPSPAVPLETSRIANIPVTALDRPVLLPQPGYLRTAANVNMRTEPDANARLLYQIPAGEVVSILGQNPERDWYHVRLGNGETGWMYAELLEGQPGFVEVVYQATPQPPQRSGTLGTTGVVAVNFGSNLRAAPDASFTALTTLPLGTEVELIARSPYSPWVKVRSALGEGWVALFTLETRAAISFLPIEYDVPLPARATATPNYSYGGGHAYPDPLGGQ